MAQGKQNGTFEASHENCESYEFIIHIRILKKKQALIQLQAQWGNPFFLCVRKNTFIFYAFKVKL